MHRILLAGLMLSLAALAPHRGGAQVPVSVTLHGGATSPTGDFGDLYDSDGFVYGVDVTLHFTGHVGISAAWSRSGFSCEGDACPSGGEAHSNHIGFGLYFRPFDTGRLRPWIRGGVVRGSFTQTGELVNTGTVIGFPFETDGGTGLDLAVGMEIPAWSLISLNPAVRYRGYTAERQRHGYNQEDFEVGFVSFELGVRIGSLH